MVLCVQNFKLVKGHIGRCLEGICGSFVETIFR